MGRVELARALPLRAPKVIDARLGAVRAALLPGLEEAHRHAHALVPPPLPLHGSEWAAKVVELEPRMAARFREHGVCFDPEARNARAVQRIGRVRPGAVLRLVLDGPPEEVVGILLRADEARILVYTGAGTTEYEAGRLRYMSAPARPLKRPDKMLPAASAARKEEGMAHEELAREVAKLVPDAEVAPGKSYTLVKVGGKTVACVRGRTSRVVLRTTDASAIASAVQAAPVAPTKDE